MQIFKQQFNNYKKTIKDISKTYKNKFFIFGQDSIKIPFLYFFDIITKKLVDLKIEEPLRNYSGSTMINSNQFFICGGVNFDMNNITKTAKIYSIAEEKFKKLPEMHDIRFNFPVLFFKDKLIVTGGRKYGDNFVAIMKECEYFDLKTKTWHKMGAMNIERCGHQILTYKGKVYVLGGLSENPNVKYLEEYDFETSTWKVTDKSLMMNMYNFEIFSHDYDEVLIVGGMHFKGFANFIHSINLRTNRVKFKGFLKQSRGNTKIFYHRDEMKLYLMGGISGHDSTDPKKYVETFDLVSGESASSNFDQKSVLKFISRYNFNRISLHVQTEPPRKIYRKKILTQK